MTILIFFSSPILFSFYNVNIDSLSYKIDILIFLKIQRSKNNQWSFNLKINMYCFKIFPFVFYWLFFSFFRNEMELIWIIKTFFFLYYQIVLCLHIKFIQCSWEYGNISFSSSCSLTVLLDLVPWNMTQHPYILVHNR